MSLKTKITEIHYTKNSKSLLLPILEFFAFFYEKITAFRNYLYDNNFMTSYVIGSSILKVVPLPISLSFTYIFPL